MTDKNRARAMELEDIRRGMAEDETPLVCQAAFHLREAIALLRAAAEQAETEQEKAA